MNGIEEQPNLPEQPAGAASPDPAPPASEGTGHAALAGPPSRWRIVLAAVLLVGLGVALARPIAALFSFIADSHLNSHGLLVPAISAYLIWQSRKELPWSGPGSIGLAVPFALLAAGAFAVAWGWVEPFGELRRNDVHSAVATGLVASVFSVALLCLGGSWVKAAIFPLGFLVFMIPLPLAVVDAFETASQRASAEVSAWLFSLVRLPYLRDGQVFQLPGITLEVAQECSGIRSSWVLFITSALASHLFLKSPWRRLALVLFVIPLGVFRNGVRILTIALLCVHVGPHMIDSIIHHRGGPFFFALSLIPLLAFAWWLRRGETGSSKEPAGG